MPLDAAHPAPTLVSSQLGPTPKPKGAQARRKPRPEPEIKLESAGKPDVERVVRAFHPLIRRLVERVEVKRDVIPLRPVSELVH